MSDDMMVSIESAAATTGISARTLRYWIATGKLTATAEKRGKRVRIGDVRHLAALTGKGSGTATSPPATVTTSAVATADTLPAVDVALILDRIEALYREQLQAKDATISEKDATISELRQCIADLEAQRQPAAAVPATAIAAIEALQARVQELEATRTESPAPVVEAAPEQPQRPWWHFRRR